MVRKVVILLGYGSPSAAPDNADEERPQRGEAGGGYGY